MSKEAQTLAKNMEVALLIDFYGDMLTEKQRDMVDQYYNQDLSLSEIAQNAGISRQGVRDSVKRAEIQMIDMEQRLGMAARLRGVRSTISEILEDVARLREENGRGGSPEAIDALAANIAVRANELLEE